MLCVSLYRLKVHPRGYCSFNGLSKAHSANFKKNFKASAPANQIDVLQLNAESVILAKNLKVTAKKSRNMVYFAFSFLPGQNVRTYTKKRAF